MLVYILTAEFGEYSDRVTGLLGAFQTVDAAVAAIMTLEEDAPWERCEVFEATIDDRAEPKRVKSFRRKDSDTYGFSRSGPFVDVSKAV